MINFLNGYKTYIVGALSILLGIVNGDMTLIMVGLTAFGLRSGIASGFKQMGVGVKKKK